MNSDKFIYAVFIIVVSISELMAGEDRLLSHEVYSVMTNNVRTEFYALEKVFFKKRVDYQVKVLTPRTSYWYDNGLSKVILKGKALAFSDRYSLHDLAAGLWDLLDTPKHGFDASVILYAKAGTCFMGVSGKMYLGVPDQCRLAVRSALGEPEWWCPHPVLFDRGRVLSESETNAALRAAHIGAIVGALADPGIRAGNPLEVRSALMILDALKAREAAQTFVDYMFYDWRAAADYRLGEGDLIPPPKYDPHKPNNLSQVQLPAFMYLPRLGDIGVPLALRRLSDATAEERSTEVGGGATPIIAIQYFRWLRYTERQALEAVTDYQGGAELSQSQKEALAEIIEVIVKKKHRTDALLDNRHPAVRTWAPSFTNHPYGAQP